MQELIITFSRNLKKLRNKRGFTQQQVADLTGIDVRLYQKYESSSPPEIKLTNLWKILSFFDVSLKELLSGE